MPSNLKVHSPDRRGSRLKEEGCAEDPKTSGFYWGLQAQGWEHSFLETELGVLNPSHIWGRGGFGLGIGIRPLQVNKPQLYFTSPPINVRGPGCDFFKINGHQVS